MSLAKKKEVKERNESFYQPHIDVLRKQLRRESVHELLAGYDPKDRDSIFSFSKRQLERTMLKAA